MARNKELWMTFVDLEKAFDRVPREVVWWALRCLGVDEWIVSVIKAMYEDATTMVRVNGRESKALKIGRSPVQISPKTNFSIMIKLPVKSTGK